MARRSSPSAATGSWSRRPSTSRRPSASPRRRSEPRASGPRRCSTAPGRASATGATAGRRCSRSAPSLPLPRGPARGRRRCRSTSAARSRSCSAAVELDIVHVHEPFAPSPPRRRCATRSRSTSGASTSRPSGSSRPRWRGRWWRSSSAGSTPARRPAARPAELMERFFPGAYELIEPGADRGERWWPGDRRRSGASGPCGSPTASRRSAARCGSSCARCGGSRRARLGGGGLVRRPRTDARASRGRLRERVHAGPARRGVAGGADRGRRRRLRRLRRPARRPAWCARRSPPARSRCLPPRLYQELIGDGERGPALPARRRAHPGGPARAPDRRPRAARASCVAQAAGAVPDWAEVADEVEDVYGGSCARRHDPRGNPELRRRGSRAGARSTSTCTCTPTTRRTAPPRSRCCWRPPASAGWGRSRSPTTTRSRARSRRARSPRRSAGSR